MSTLRVERAASISGMRTPLPGGVAAARLRALPTSMRKSSSSRTPARNSPASSVGLMRRPSAVWCSMMRASSSTASESRWICSSRPGRRTFTTQSRPPWPVAAYTWAIDALASGSQSKVVNASSGVIPSSSSSWARMSSSGSGRTWDWSLASSSHSSDGSRSERVDATWPSFTNSPPASSSVARSCGPNSAVNAGSRRSTWRRASSPLRRAMPASSR